jgi:polyisoprenyl-teichoic acid--peptidoglycan teichoic acid transferase
MRTSRRKIFFLLAAALVMILVAAGVVIYPKATHQWSAPLGPGLELPTHTPTREILVQLSNTPVALLSTQTIETLPPAQTAGVTATLAPSATSTPQPLCGGPPLMTVLAIGADSDDYDYGLADAIRIARVDFVTPKVSVLSMPRDLWVEIPDISKHYNITHGKLNQAYFYGGPGMGYYTGPGGGPGLLARTLDLNFGLRVDHYGAVNMQTFVKIVDAVGGIDVYLPTDVDGRPIDEHTADMGYFTAGQHHFTGDEALRFSRIRKKYNDFTRMDHQNMVICALKSKLTSPSVLPKIPKIIAAFQGSVLTDLSLEQISQMACLLPHLKRENLLFTSLPDEILSPSRVYSPQQKSTTFVMDADFNVIRDYIQKFVEGTWPSEPDQPTCP